MCKVYNMHQKKIVNKVLFSIVQASSCCDYIFRTEEKKLKHMLHTLERQKEFSKNYGKKLVEKLSDQRKKKRFDPLDLQKMTDEEKQKYKEERKVRAHEILIAKTIQCRLSHDIKNSKCKGLFMALLTYPIYSVYPYASSC